LLKGVEIMKIQTHVKAGGVLLSDGVLIGD
jgi:hypothetical protein